MVSDNIEDFAGKDISCGGDLDGYEKDRRLPKAQKL
jgi:hypothetical protein